VSVSSLPLWRDLTTLSRSVYYKTGAVRGATLRCLERGWNRKKAPHEPMEDESAMPTMRDVAGMAGVSLKTVSRVVNGEPGVRPETARRVQQAVLTSGFHPNLAARSLRGKRALPLIGLVLRDLANPFYSGIAQGVEEIAAEHAYFVIIASAQEHASRDDDLLATLHRQPIAGLLLVPVAASVHLERETRVPVVCADRPSPAGISDTVLVDNQGGAHEAVAYLIAQGHRRVGVIGDVESHFTMAERLSGYRLALEAAGIPFDPALLALGASDVRLTEAAALRLLAIPGPPTALFAMNNRACVGALRAITVRQAPTVVAVFDEMELAGVLPHLVATVRQDPVEIGRVAARQLFARLAGNQDPPRTVVLPARLEVCIR
jgi:LacI family transcriptional regulator